MKKKLYLILPILIIISLLSSAAICNFGQAQNSVETKDQAAEENNQSKETKKDSSSDKTTASTTSGENKSGNNDSQSTNNANNNPIINGIIISNLDGSETAHSKEEWYVEANQQYFLTADVTDTDNDPITYKWSADGGLFDNPTAPKVMWSTPAFPETYHIYLEINDGKGGKASFSKVLRVIDNSSLNVGSPPVVSDIEIKDSPLYCDTTYEVRVIASDPDNDIDYYNLTPSGGTLLNQSVNVMDWITPSNPGTYSITVKVVDKEGRSTPMTKNFDVVIKYEIVDPPSEAIVSITISSEHIYTNTKYEVYAKIYDPNDYVRQYIFETNYGVLSDQSANVIYWTTPSTPGSYPIRLTLKDKNGIDIDNSKIGVFNVEEKQ